MAAIGLYGVYYSVANMTDGVLAGYAGVKTMGKAISATFTPAEADTNPLYANNGIAETDAAVASGGELSLGLDRLDAQAISDLFGLVSQTETVTVGEATAEGTGFDYTGEEEANAVGVAFIRQKQENGDRNIHEAIIFSNVTFAMPTEEAQTMGETIEWQTPTISGTVAGSTATGTYPWKKAFTFPTQAAAIQFITDYFAAGE